MTSKLESQNSKFEREFTEFLDRASDVLSYVALDEASLDDFGNSFRIDYLKPDGSVGFCNPGWVVVQRFDDNEVNWIVETKIHKVAESEENKLAIKEWCRKQSLLSGKTWDFICVYQNDFDSNRTTFRSLVISIIGKAMLEMRDKLNIVVTQQELREWREDGRA